MADQFTANKFRWLAKVTRKNKMPVTAYRVAFLLVEYLNRGKGYAYPSVKTLSKNLDITEQATRKGLRCLRENGLLAYESCSGSSKPNHYYIKLETSKIEAKSETNVSFKDDKNNADDTQPRNERFPRTKQSFHENETVVAPIPMNQSNEESNERDSSLQSGELKESKAEAQPLGFDDLKRAYPVKSSEDLKWAKQATSELVASGKTTIENLVLIASRYGATCDNASTDKQFIPSLQNWLKRELWRNETDWPKPKTVDGNKKNKQSAIDLLIDQPSVFEGFVE